MYLREFLASSTSTLTSTTPAACMKVLSFIWFQLIVLDEADEGSLSHFVRSSSQGNQHRSLISSLTGLLVSVTLDDTVSAKNIISHWRQGAIRPTRTTICTLRPDAAHRLLNMRRKWPEESSWYKERTWETRITTGSTWCGAHLPLSNDLWKRGAMVLSTMALNQGYQFIFRSGLLASPIWG